MRPNSKLALALFTVIAFAMPSVIHAQLFGSARQLGQPIQRRQGASAAARSAQDAGQVQGNERFLRNNRRRGDFVGSDRFERRNFVGSQQGTANGQAISSVAGVRPERDRSAQINQPLQPTPRNRAHYPRLQIGFATGVSGIQQPGDLQRELENPDYFSTTNRYEVFLANRIATLRGVVVDARERDLAELLVSFEPGISAVRNELRIANASPPSSALVPSQVVSPTDLPVDLPPPVPVPAPTPVPELGPIQK